MKITSAHNKIAHTRPSATCRDIRTTCRATDSDTPLKGVSRVVSADVALTAQKVCSECHVPKSTAKFLPSRTSADGFVARCFDCVLAEAQRNRAHREQVLTATLVQDREKPSLESHVPNPNGGKHGQR